MPYSGDAGVAVVVPIKSFRLAKGRLAQVLNDAEREELARLTAQRVVEAAAGCALFVVCDDDDVAEWAAGVGLCCHGCSPWFVRYCLVLPVGIQFGLQR
ncbi:MAG: hypothetical protein EBV42_07600 [Actinobacteria bacterium]|nr:hypothetical protein [Actinomycetota bacterium]